MSLNSPRFRNYRATDRCWFTGLVPSTDERALDVWSKEHIVPQSSHLYKAISGINDFARANIVASIGYVNWCLGSLPLVVKFRVRERLLLAIYGTTDMEAQPPAVWSEPIRNLILDIVREEDYRWRLHGKKVYHNPIVVPAAGIRLWSRDNPYLPITAEDLVERDRLLDDILQLNWLAASTFFGLSSTPEIEQALANDLKRHEVERTKNSRRKKAA